jgi:4-amino-4-deoxy-L-arabinose transferase-like glycosyltransferase
MLVNLSLSVAIIGIITQNIWVKMKILYLLNEYKSHKNRIKRKIIYFKTTESNSYIILLTLILFGGVFLRVLYINQPIFHDEAKSFYSFISPSWIDAISNYYIPNNHIFLSICSRFFYLLLGNEEWIIRIPIFISGILVMIFGFIFSRYFFGRNIALIFTALISSSIPLISYSTNARGYMIIILSVLILFCLLKFIDYKLTLFSGGIVVLISSLGIWTVPSMVLPLIMVFSWYLYLAPKGKLKKNVFAVIAITISVIGISFILYSPAVFRSGLNSIIANQYITPIPLVKLLGDLHLYIKNLLYYFLSGYGSGLQFIFILLFSLGLIFSLKNRYQRSILFSIFIMGIFLIFGITRFPPNRVLLFLIPIFWVFTTIGITLVITFFSKKWKVPINPLTYFVSLFLFLNGSLICVKNDGLISLEKSLICPQSEEIIERLKPILNENDIIETSTPLAGPVRYYLMKAGIDKDQFFWYHRNKNLNPLESAERIFIITRNERNSINSFGIDFNYLNRGFNTPVPWKEYGNVTVYIVNKINNS